MYFDDQMDDAHRTGVLLPTDVLLYKINFTTSCVALFFGVLVQVFAVHSLGQIHANLRFLMRVYSLACCTLPLSNAITSYEILTNNSIERSLTRTNYLVPKNILSVSAHMIRLMCTSICFERVFATVNKRTYESNKRLYFLAPLITSVALCVAGGLGIVFNNSGAALVYMMYAFFVTTDILTVVSVQLVSYVNKRINEQNARSHIASTLTCRYQIVENIRTLTLLRVQAIITLIATITALAASITGRRYSKFYGIPMYFTVFNLYIVAIAVFWMSRNPFIKNCIHSITQRISKTKSSFKEASTSNRMSTTVKMALGNKVKGLQTADEHFTSLRTLWN